MKHIPHLYLSRPWGDHRIEVTPGQVRHLSEVLRIRSGDLISYTDGRGVIGSGTWLDEGVARGEENSVARPSRLILVVAPPAHKDRLRFTVEKLAELGIESLLWLETRHGSRRVPPASKLQSWATSGLEQSRGAWLMSVNDSLVTWPAIPGPTLVCDPEGDDEAAAYRTVVIGPEGGFVSGEVPDDLPRVSLGPTILRVETAAIAAAIKFVIK